MKLFRLPTDNNSEQNYAAKQVGLIRAIRPQYVSVRLVGTSSWESGCKSESIGWLDITPDQFDRIAEIIGEGTE